VQKHCDLFSGYGGFSLAFQRHGFRTVSFAETEPFACKVLAHHWPTTPNLGDVKEIDGHEISREHGDITVVTFGSPCQDWSVAGKRAGITGERSGLFFEAIRIVRDVRPAFAVFENVCGLFSQNRGWDFAAVLDSLAECGAMDIAWRVLDAQFFGVPQRRRRIFIVADFAGERAAEILSLTEGVRGHSAARSQARQDVAPCLRSGAVGGRSHGKVNGTDQQPMVVANSLGANAGRHQIEQTYVPVTHSLRADGFDASEDGTGRGTPLVPVISPCLTQNYGKQPDNSDTNAGPMLVAFTCKDHGQDAGDLAPTLRGMQHQASTPNGGGQVAIAFNWQEGHNFRSSSNPLRANQTEAVAFHENQRAETTLNDTAGSLKTGGGKPGQGYPAVAVSLRGREGGGTAEVGGEVSPAMRASKGGGDKPHVLTTMSIRRLTPLECERLMGLPDGWTALPGAADGPRYRALGNGVVVPVVEQIAERMRGI
jgi:DNA (cytosine-5)-methyltransferase 1